MYKWECPICGKQPEHFGIKEFAMSPRTTLFGEFNFRDADGNIRTVNRKVNKPVCSEECKRKNEEQYFVEEYKGTRIYPMCRKTPCFSYGDIRHFHRIYVSN